MKNTALTAIIPKPLRNKYLLTLVVFLVWMLFLDKHNFMLQYNLASTCSNYEHEIVEYKEQIIQLKTDLKDLDKDQEKYAREKYYMKKPNEEVFIFKQRN